MEPTDLLERPIYSIPQIDRLVGLKPGTARRWLEGYSRAGRTYPPVLRSEPLGSEIVTWGEFVETRLLAEYRDAGVSVIRMRPAIERLREQFNTRYPLAEARPFLNVLGRELVSQTQKEVALDKALQLVVVRSGQLVLAKPTDHFVRSVEYGGGEEGVAERIHPAPDLREVVIDPLRQFGEPVVRSVPTEIIAEQVRAGDSIEMISELYELTTSQVAAAIRYELLRANGMTDHSAA